MDEEQFGTSADYLRAFAALQAEGIAENHAALLRAHLAAPGCATTWADLAEAVGYPNSGTVHLQYGRFARRVARQLGLSAKPHDPGGGTWWLWTLVRWAEDVEPESGHTVFVLRRPAVEALEQLGWGTPAGFISLSEGAVRRVSSNAYERNPETRQKTRRFWMCHWKNRLWRNDVNVEYKQVSRAAGNSFTKRGISPGDDVYIVSLAQGQLFLGGRMTVERIVSRQEAVTIFGNPNFYEAEEYVIAVDGSGTPLNLHRRLSPELTRQIRFESKSGPKAPFFVSDTELDKQATRVVRELTLGSAVLLNRIIEATDCLPRTGQLITVSDSWLISASPIVGSDDFRLPDEVPYGGSYSEGVVSRVEVNRFERDPQARKACIAAHGTACCVCGFSFGAVYGHEADGYIHVHHLRPLAEAGGKRAVDPAADLRPVCPNCHAVLHLGGACRTIEQVRQLLTQHMHAVPGKSAELNASTSRE